MLQARTLWRVAVTPERVFGLVVKDLRQQRGLSQEALSFTCRRHRTYISLLERGKSSPSLRTLWLLAEALHVAPSEIIRRMEATLAED